LSSNAPACRQRQVYRFRPACQQRQAPRHL